MTLEQLAAATLATPPASTFHSAPLRVLRDNNNNMGASESVLRDSMSSPQTERKMPKPQSRHSNRPKQHDYSSPGATAKETRKTSKPQAQPRPFNSPSQHVNSSPRTVQEMHKTPKPQSQSFKSLMKQHVYSSVQKTKKEKKKDRKDKTTPRRPLGPGTQPGGHESSPIVLESDEEASSHTAFADDGVELKLGDISDLELRKKTAQLMAVAPALLVREKTIPPADPVPEDEVKVKIDFDDEFFIYDAECPDTQLPDLRRPKQRSHPKKVKKGLQKAALKPRKGLATKKTKESGEYTGDINRGIRETSHDREFIASDDQAPLDDSDADYSDSDQSVATVTSSTESDTDMAVDEESESASSVSTEMASEMDTDDDEDLEIDMQPEYAYNSDVLASPNPG
jgi:hypothetical protein